MPARTNKNINQRPEKKNDSPISCRWSLSIPPESMRKLEVFWCFRGVHKVTSGMKGLISSFSRYSWSRDPKLQLQKQSPEVFDQKADLKILQYSQENTCVWSLFLIKLQTFRWFPENIANFFITPILKNSCERLVFKLTVTTKIIQKTSTVSFSPYFEMV